jgi:hypothetical protein
MGNQRNPLGDGRSGAPGNGNASPPPLATQVGAGSSQRQGSTRNPQSVSVGGPILKLDPPSLRGGLVADPNRRPFKLGMSERSMSPSDEDAQPAGSVVGDSGDDNDDPTAGE